MDKKEKTRRILYRAAAVILGLCVIRLSIPEEQDGVNKEGFGKVALGQAEDAAVSLWCPALIFTGHTEKGGIWQKISSQFPILYLYGKEKDISLQSESGGTYEDIIRAEGHDEYTDNIPEESLDTPERSDGRVLVDRGMEKLLEDENKAVKRDGEDEENREETADSDISGDSVSGSGLSEEKESGKVQDYQWEYYRKYDSLVKEFYAVDASTAIDESQLNLKALLGRDLSIVRRTDDEPQILIYHTHSQESFANSVPGDENTTIMGVGEVLAELLRERYGYNVMHHLGKYDVENRDYAYNNSLPVLEQLLLENPSIEVVIDLHRDEVAADRKLVTEIDGKPTAKFMFFNGLSRTKKHGNIEYLPNENISDNLAFSFQMQALCNEYYPGLTRRIYLKGYRYNMHLKPRYLLIEMGAQTNTWEECYNACVPLARILDMELSGVDFGYGEK